MFTRTRFEPQSCNISDDVQGCGNICIVCNFTFIQGRSHIFEHDDLEVSQSPYAIHDGSMSSSQSISSSNSGREADTLEETEPAPEGAATGTCVYN